MEDCRHQFLKDVLGLDIGEQDANGVNIVLTRYTLRFKRPHLVKPTLMLTVFRCFILLRRSNETSKETVPYRACIMALFFR